MSLSIDLVLEEVKKEVCTRLKKKSILDLDSIDAELGVKIIEDEGLTVYPEFKTQLVSPWAIAKYMVLIEEENTTISKVEQEIKELSGDKVEVFFTKKLSCMLQIVPKYIEGAKKQSLTLRYFLDEDERMQYKIIGTANWGWDISKTQLKGLLNNTGFMSESFSNTLSKPKKVCWLIRFLAKLGIK